MTEHDPTAVLAYWLIPAEPTRSFFSSLIKELSERFDAPLFEPHLTIYSTSKGDQDAAEVLGRTFSVCEPFRLTVRDIEHSDELTKTLFVQFEPDRRLSEASDALRRASDRIDEYELNPHLSLIYQKIDPAVKSEVANSITLPFAEVTFDLAKAIVSPAQIKSRKDVEAWRVLAARPLRPHQVQ
ncbi:MAG: hypothetical protein DLM73_08530 [Chthoniobacterales bacterium]|nr:MAG: hypothetical protein DLM73_08530 [Chthoniobacterales bacterium]